MKNFFLAAVLLTLLTGCCCTIDDGSEQVESLIFQSEYTNYAWGYNHNGWMLNNTGQVKRFQKSANWVFPDSLGYISAVDMYKNITACDSVLAQISSNDFKLYAEKAISCANGPMSKATNTMADAGAHIQAVYLYEPVKNRYKRVILEMTGDWSQQNLAPRAKEVVEWMMTVE